MAEVNACGLNNSPQKKEEELQRINELYKKYAEERGVRIRPNETLNEIDERGVFVRQANSFITPFGNKKGEFEALPNRYKIYWGCLMI